MSHPHSNITCIIFKLNMENLRYLKRSGSVWLLQAEVDLASDGQPHEEPVAKAVVIDKLEDVFHCQVDQRHDTLDSRWGK